MSEGLEHPKKLRKTREVGDGLKLYEFTERAIEIPLEWSDRMLEYAELYEVEKHALQKGRKLDAKLIARKKELYDELKPFLAEYLKREHKSVLKNSIALKRRPDESGKDSYVYYIGSLKSFLEKPDTPHYLVKYSVPGKEVGRDNVLYLQKKYEILKKILPDHILRAWFFYGEFRDTLPAHGLGDFSTSLRAVTIQREVRGKTFAEMTAEERRRPKVIKALKKAIRAHDKAERTLARARKIASVTQDFKLNLDAGIISKDRPRKFPYEQFKSPNVMYDEQLDRVFFIDMGWGTWDEQKKDVYKALMGANRF